MPRLNLHFALALVLASVATVSVSEAQTGKANRKQAPQNAQATRREARDAYDAGAVAFEKGEYQVALDNFSKANGLIPSPIAAYWVARSLDALGKKAEAIEAYSKVLTGPDAAKLGPDKTETAKARLSLLEKSVTTPSKSSSLPPLGPPVTAPPPSTPVPAPPSESEPILSPAPSPAVEPESPPPETQASLPPDDSARDFSVESPVTLDLPPREAPRNFAELGVFGGVLFVSHSHDLRRPSYIRENPDKFPDPSYRRNYSSPVWLAGVRAAYFPLPYLGLSLEYAHGFGSVDADESPGAADVSDSAQFNTGRFEIIGQIPLPVFVPFAHVGAGVLHASSDHLGSDIDFLGVAGLGGKFIATEVLRPYFDLRLSATQSQDDGIAVHPEVLVGLSFQLGGD